VGHSVLQTSGCCFPPLAENGRYGLALDCRQGSKSEQASIPLIRAWAHGPAVGMGVQ